MSLARDDIGISGASNALKSEFIKSGMLENQSNSQKVSGSENEKPEINDVFEKESSKSLNNYKKNIEQLQQDYNSLEIKKQLLENSDAALARIEESAQNPGESELEKFEKEIEKISSTGQNPKEQELKAETAETVQSPQNNESGKEKEDSARKVAELRVKVSEKQQQLAELQQKLYDKVNSTVELHIGKTNNSEEALQQQAENLKNSVIEDIKEEPQKSPKVHITNLDKDLILAMLSLRR